MKKMKSFGMMMILVAIVFTACNNDDENSENTIEGTYSGILTNKSATGTIIGTGNATADISKTSDGLIQVHCFGTGIDTTFMLNYFPDNDSVFVCLTGNDFRNTYGHMMGQGHMMGGMMGDIKPGQTQWQHHMADEHKPGDIHYGGFDMMNHSFGYTFHKNNGSSHMIMNFEGTKK
ncbi:MAG TPA: hypothetical protein PLG30_14855 [Bacteroidia bacterium]|jgi:hypothetical protein|nr:hypothetical protein [Bacteroidia bacterium]